MRYGWAAVGIGTAIALAIAYSRMRWPVLGRITSKFGEPRPSGPHNGVDIAAPIGTPVRAPFTGVVTFTGYTERGGNTVVMELENGYRAGFAHLSRIDVATGDAVGKGVVIGAVGSTGTSTGPHLHYTLKRDGEWVDPEIIHAA
jgi:murein DD-endopeptidase MepM/ murein hydrolase activator NlpD